MICIYKILNLITKEFYIGSTDNFLKRKRNHLHLLRKNKHHSIILQRSFNKYSERNFLIEPLEVFNDRNDLLLKEQEYLNKLNPRYNLAKNTIAPMLGRKHSASSRKKISLKNMGNKNNLGRKASKETKLKMRQSRLNRKHSQQTKIKLSEIAKIRKFHLHVNHENRKKIIVDNLGNRFVGLKMAANFHGISSQTVCDILRGRHNKTRSGVSFRYDENT